MSARGPVLTTAALAVVALAAALGVALGTAPGSGATAAPVPAAATGTAAPDGFTGRWSGPLRERGGPTVDLRLTVTGGRAATLDIPALGCTYTGTIGAPGGVTRLRTVANPQRLCTPRATVRLTPLAAHSLRYELLRACDAGGACTLKDAAALLTGP